MSSENPVADLGGRAPAALTRAFATAGRVSLGRLVRIDLRGFAARVSSLAEEHSQSPVMVRAGGVVAWAGLLVRNLELTFYWGATWAVAHLAMVIVASLVAPHAPVPVRVSIAVDLFLGLMFLISVLRLALTTARVRQLAALRPVETGARLLNPPRPPLLLRLLEPGDLDLAAVAVVVAVTELLVR